MAFGGRSGSSLYRDSASPTSAMWSCQTPTAWKVPLTGSRGVFHADRQSGGGQWYPSVSWERLWGGRAREPSQAMHWSLSAWPLCRCHSDSCGRTGVWRCCPQDHAHHPMGQGRGASSGWLGCRERVRATGSGAKNTNTLGHQALFKHPKTQMLPGQKEHRACSW